MINYKIQSPYIFLASGGAQSPIIIIPLVHCGDELTQTHCFSKKKQKTQHIRLTLNLIHSIDYVKTIIIYNGLIHKYVER